MGLHSRLFKLALALFILFALTSIPGTWSPTPHSAGSWLSVSPAWAGSPDETLKPRPAGRFVSISLQAQTSAQVASPRTQVVTVRTRFEQFVLVWKISLASVLRF